MIDGSTLVLFCAAALALLVVPGPAVLYVVTQSVDRGRAAGLVSMLGIHAGTVVHVTAAALGVSAVLASSALAFDAIKYAGAAYLVVLGVRALLTRSASAAEAAHGGGAPLRGLFARGVVVQILNPKTALFFLAFLPQFVDPSAGHVGLQLLFLGVVFIALGVVSDGSYALLAGTAGNWLRRSAGFLRVRRYVSGTVFIGLGVAAAVSGSRKT